MTFGRATRIVLLLLGLNALVGCARRPRDAASVLPPVTLTCTHFVGGPLGSLSPSAASPEDQPAALVAKCVLHRGPDIDRRDFVPLGSMARLVTARRGDEPVLAGTRLTQPIQVLLSPNAAATQPAGVVQPVASVESVVIPGVTTAFRIAPTGPAGSQPIELQLYQSSLDSDLQLAIATSGPLATNEDSSVPQESPSKSVTQREVAILDGINSAQPPTIRLRIPWRVDGSSSDLLAEISLRAGKDDPETEALLSSARQELDRNRAKGSAKVPAAQVLAGRALLESTLPLLSQPSARRSALIMLAAQTGAAICQDAALVADDSTLEQLAAAINAQATAVNREIDLAQWGLVIDLTALKVMADLQSAEKLPPALQSVLALHTGEAGRRAGAIEEAIRASPTRADLENRLVAENLIALEDTSPSARVRAIDWLSLRGRAPRGFDPLAPPRQRREALEAASTQPASR